MEIIRYRGEIVFLQPHEYTPEINQYINKVETLFIPYIILIFLIAIFMITDLWKFIFGDSIDGKIYKVILTILVKFSAVFYIFSIFLQLQEAQSLLHRTGKIIMPIYKLATPYIIIIGIWILSIIIIKSMEKDYRKQVSKNKDNTYYKEWQEFTELLKIKED
jgi:hypothetical protein